MMQPKKFISWTELGRLSDLVIRDERLPALAKILILALAHEVNMKAGSVTWRRIQEITKASRGQLYWSPSAIGRNQAYKDRSPMHMAEELGYLVWKKGAGGEEVAHFTITCLQGSDAVHQVPVDNRVSYPQGSDAMHQGSDAMHQGSDAMHQGSDAMHQGSDAMHQVDWRQKLQADMKSYMERQHSEMKQQVPEVAESSRGRACASGGRSNTISNLLDTNNDQRPSEPHGSKGMSQKFREGMLLTFLTADVEHETAKLMLDHADQAYRAGVPGNRLVALQRVLLKNHAKHHSAWWHIWLTWLNAEVEKEMAESKRKKAMKQLSLLNQEQGRAC